MLNSAWPRARRRVGLPQVRVHDLKHTFGRRLRAAGVSFEDRQDLLGHRSGRITTHYSAAELSRLIDAANCVCEKAGNVPELVVLRRLSVRLSHAKITQWHLKKNFRRCKSLNKLVAGAESNHRHADFQSRVGSPKALYFKELPGRPLPNWQYSAGLCTTSSRKTHARYIASGIDK